MTFLQDSDLHVPAQSTYALIFSPPVKAHCNSYLIDILVLLQEQHFPDFNFAARLKSIEIHAGAYLAPAAIPAVPEDSFTARLLEFIDQSCDFFSFN